MFDHEVKERFIVFWLSSSNVVTGFEVITEGVLNSSLAHPREIFRGAIIATCNSIIIAHNHPSGNCQPSPEDLKMTAQLVEAGKIIGIRVFDHIIFGDNEYLSFVEAGLI